MPKTSKIKTTKNFLVDILREPFVTKEDASHIYDRIREEVIAALSEGKVVNLFDLVLIESVDRVGHIKTGAFGESCVVIPDKLVLRAKVYSRLKKEWNQITEAREE